MNPHQIDQYLNVVISCLGAEFDYLFEMPDHERDINFKLNFANKQEQIINNVNAVVLPDLGFFSNLMLAFTSEVKNGFNSTDVHQIKQRHADRIAAKVDIIQKGTDRLARTLRDEWSLPEDPRFSYFFSHKDVELYAQRIQREMHLNGLINGGRTEEEAQMARHNLDAYKRGRREGEAHLYFALLIGDWTERFLSGYLALYCSRNDAPVIYNKSSPDELTIMTALVKESHELLLLPALNQKGLNGTFQGEIINQNDLDERTLIRQQKSGDIRTNQSGNDLTQRERALIHCYKQLAPIKKGEPLYDDYIAFAKPRKRISYPNDSKRKADLLIKSIEKVLPHLTESERQQAESEIKTIVANFSN